MRTTSFLILSFLFIFFSCGKEKETIEDCTTSTPCDLKMYEGKWSFEHTNNQTFEQTSYLGKIEKVNDSTLFVKYRDDSKSPNSIELKTDCETGNFSRTIDLGNQKQKRLFGIISTTKFTLFYSETNTSTQLNFQLSGTKK